MIHVVLLGDSILDNGAYTDGGPAVVDQLREVLGSDSAVTLLAVDGARIEDVAIQTGSIPPDATHLVVSMGGNDALDAIAVLSESVDTVGEGLLRMEPVLNRFEDAYLDAMTVLQERPIHVIACTIYNGRFEPGPEQRMITTAARLFNDVIIGLGAGMGFEIIELRRVCTEAEDYANPIEPSEIGGSKIAAAIADAVQRTR